MQRRNLLKLAGVSAAVLAIGGGTLALIEPGVHNGRLTPAGRLVFSSVGQALLDGSLPVGEPARAVAVEAMLSRIDTLVAGLPPHAQAELSQLLAVLASGIGRRTLGGLAQDWASASIESIQDALQTMRVSGISLRRQGYQALHDIAGSAYFSDASAWGVLGYPGPLKI